MGRKTKSLKRPDLDDDFGKTFLTLSDEIRLRHPCGVLTLKLILQIIFLYDACHSSPSN